MGGIKSFLLKSIGFVLLSFAYLGLLLSLSLTSLDTEFKVLKPQLVSAITPFASQYMEKALDQQMGQGSPDIMEQAKAFCESGQAGSIPQDSELPFDVEEMCAKVKAGTFTKNDLYGTISGDLVKNYVDSLFVQVQPQLVALKTLGNQLFVVFIVCFALSALFIFLDNFNPLVFLRTFSLHSFIHAILTALTLAVFWYMSPSLAGSLVNSISKKGDVPPEVIILLNSLVPTVVGWAREYVFKLLVPFAIIAAVSIVAWLVCSKLSKPAAQSAPKEVPKEKG